MLRSLGPYQSTTADTRADVFASDLAYTPGHGPGDGAPAPLGGRAHCGLVHRRLAFLDLSPAGERAWPVALARLRRLGHGSGRAYATGIAAACLLGGAAGDRAAPDRG